MEKIECVGKKQAQTLLVGSTEKQGTLLSSLIFTESQHVQNNSDFSILL